MLHTTSSSREKIIHDTDNPMNRSRSTDRSDNDTMNNPNPNTVSNMATEFLSNSAISKNDGVESRKRKSGFGESEDDMKKPSKIRRTDEDAFINESQYVEGNDPNEAAISSQCETSLIHSRPSMFGNLAPADFGSIEQKAIDFQPKEAENTQGAITFVPSILENPLAATPGDDNDGFEGDVVSPLSQKSIATPFNSMQNIMNFSELDTVTSPQSNANPTLHLPNEVVVQIFAAMIRLPPLNEVRTHPYTDSSSESDSESQSGTDSDDDSDVDEFWDPGEPDGIITAICFALTCRRYWIIFRDLCCYGGTNGIFIDYKISLSQQAILAPLLETWMGPKYRRSQLLTLYPRWATSKGDHGSQGYINMFLARKVYGDGKKKHHLERELNLWDRYKARTQIYDCSGPNMQNDDEIWKKGYFPRVSFPSPYGMGDTWYLAAAKAYLKLFIKWKFEASGEYFINCDSFIHSVGARFSMQTLKKTAIFSWAEKERARVYPGDYVLTELEMETVEVATEILEFDRDVEQEMVIELLFTEFDEDEEMMMELLFTEFTEFEEDDEDDDRNLRASDFVRYKGAIMSYAAFVGDNPLWDV